MHYDLDFEQELAADAEKIRELQQECHDEASQQRLDRAISALHARTRRSTRISPRGKRSRLRATRIGPPLSIICKQSAMILWNCMVIVHSATTMLLWGAWGC